jgi:transcriptional regulator with XRE-family HTH domain
MHAGNAIKTLQDRYGYTGTELAEMLDIAPQQLSRWRQSDDIKLSVIFNICDVLGIEVSEFIDAAK